MKSLIFWAVFNAVAAVLPGNHWLSLCNAFMAGALTAAALIERYRRKAPPAPQGIAIPVVIGTARVEAHLIERSEFVPPPSFIVTFWNGCAMPIDRSSEQGRLALASGLLLRFHWHRRPRA